MHTPQIRAIPPSPKVMSRLMDEFKRLPEGFSVTFQQFLHIKGYNNYAVSEPMMDSGAQTHADAHGLRLIPAPNIAVAGSVRTIVLLVDFPDHPGALPSSYYRDAMFSKNAAAPRSLRDFYAEVSHGKVDITGEVHGWLRLPNSMAYYANGESGRSWDSYPNNAPRMAEDAVNAALQAGVVFEPELDVLGGRVVTALVIVHAGEGAENLDPSIAGRHIWSHKWGLRETITVAANLEVTTYLTVPESVPVGTSAHELGHLVFQWDDFYDPNFDEDGQTWDGSGAWDLMAGGAHNGNGQSPAHPAALHKIQHGWLPVRDVVETTTRLTIAPVSDEAGEVVRVVGPRYENGQYLLLESRTRTGFDRELPGEGLLVWRIDERKDMNGPADPGMMLLQADGRHSLATVYDQNIGDRGDPFPGTAGRTTLDEMGAVSTTFPNSDLSGVRLSNIAWDPRTGEATLDVEIEESETPSRDGPIGGIVSRRATPNLRIPDADPRGVESVLSVEGAGAIVRVTVEVTIEHAFFDDLRIDLVAPSGETVRLHDRARVSPRDGVLTFASTAGAALQRLVGAHAAGTWTLRVFDLVRYDEGMLRAWSLSLELRDIREAALSDRPALLIPDDDALGVSTTLRMEKGGIVHSLVVGLDIDHTYPGDLLIELIGPGGRRALLHNRVGTERDDLKDRLESWTDSCLAPLIGETAAGDWTLRLSDRAREDRGILNAWSLDLGLIAADAVEEHAVASDTSVGMHGDSEYVGAIEIDVEGTGQVPDLSLDLDVPRDTTVEIELVAPSGQRAQMTFTGRAASSAIPIEFTLSSHPELAVLGGLPIYGAWVLRLRMRTDTETVRVRGWRLRLPYVAATRTE